MSQFPSISKGGETVTQSYKALDTEMGSELKRLSTLGSIAPSNTTHDMPVKNLH